MTRDEQAAILVQCFGEASRFFKNPGDCGHTPQSYSDFVAGQIRRFVELGPKPTEMTVSEALDFADALERGEFEAELDVLMGMT